MFRLILIVAVASGGFLILVPAIVSADSGGLNAEGCHTNRKTGDHHCHRKATSRPGRSPYQSDLDGGAPNLRAISGSTGRAFANCSEARAAGAAPVRRGDPGFGSHLDRDGDGVGCE